MKTSNRRAIRSGSLILTASALMFLAACLPDGDSIREKKLANFVQSKAASYADSLKTFSVQNQGLLSEGFISGALPTPGFQGTSANGTMAYAYCVDDAGTEENHMVLTWYNTSDAGNFVVMGVGQGAGPSIAQALAKELTPESIGVAQNGVINLRGPRGNGVTQINLADTDGCAALTIPVGAPVIIVENLKAPLVDQISASLYEYRSLPCPTSGDIGSIVQRCQKEEGHDCPKNVPADSGLWEAYTSSCAGAISTRNVQINTTDETNLSAALDLSGASDYQDALNRLMADRACRNAKQMKVEINEDGEEIEVVDEGNEENYDTCAQGIQTEVWDGSGENELGEIIDTSEELEVNCGVGRTGLIPKDDEYNTVEYQGYRGAWHVGNGWQGTASYVRDLYDADASYEDGTPSESTRWGKWRGENLNCARPIETLTISCEDVFSDKVEQLQGSGKFTYTILVNDGYKYTRSNSVSGWEDKDNFIPNPPQPTEWQFESVGCVAEIFYEFNMCPTLGSEFTTIQTGMHKRKITATGTIGEYEMEPPVQWTWVRHNICRKVETEEVPCEDTIDTGVPPPTLPPWTGGGS